MTRGRRRFQGGIEQAAVARDWVGEQLDAAGVASEDADAVRLAVTEAATNILRHAYEGRYPAAFDLDIEIAVDQIAVQLRDEGRPFTPGEPSPPDPEALAEGGYGLFLIASLMDDVSYSAGETRGTLLRLVKRRPPPSGSP
jgi:serine/threonine-protein kinase RsbW